MQIKVFSGFSKRINSTKQPTGGTTVDVLLKDECSILNPTFILNSLDFSINYVQAFGNYYFCDVRNLDGHRSELNCSLDHLATFKTEIGSYNGFVEYTSSSSRVDILDPRNIPTDQIVCSTSLLSFSNSNFFNQGGCYILGLINDDADGSVGAVSYYKMDTASMRTFSQSIFAQNILDALENQYYGVADGIVSCIWLPLYSEVGGSPATVKVARESIGVTAPQISNRRAQTSGTTTLNFMTGSGGAGSSMTYLEKAPYCTGFMYLPFVGMVPLDMDAAAYYKEISVNVNVDILTGDTVYELYYGSVKTSTYNGNCATKIPLSSAGFDGLGVATGAITAIGGVVGTAITIASGGAAAPAVAAGVGATAGGAMSSLRSAEFHSMINGSNSSAIGVALGTQPVIQIFQNVPSETTLTSYKTEQGMPYYKHATIGNLSGYVQCSGASVSIPGDGSEQNTVNGYLNSGFYYE